MSVSSVLLAPTTLSSTSLSTCWEKKLKNGMSLTCVDELCSCWLAVSPFVNDLLRSSFTHTYFPKPVGDFNSMCRFKFVADAADVWTCFCRPSWHNLHKNERFLPLESVLIGTEESFKYS